MLTISAVEQVFFRNSGMDAAQAETAQGCAVEGGEERISCSAALQPVLINKKASIKLAVWRCNDLRVLHKLNGVIQHTVTEAPLVVIPAHNFH